jgi:hypothetical protein
VLSFSPTTGAQPHLYNKDFSLISQGELGATSTTSVVIPVTANSLPPLKPIENNKYKEIKFFEAAGTSKSLLTYFAKTPKMKKVK